MAGSCSLAHHSLTYMYVCSIELRNGGWFGWCIFLLTPFSLFRCCYHLCRTLALLLWWITSCSFSWHYQKICMKMTQLLSSQQLKDRFRIFNFLTRIYCKLCYYFLKIKGSALMTSILFHNYVQWPASLKDWNVILKFIIWGNECSKVLAKQRKIFPLLFHRYNWLYCRLCYYFLRIRR